VNGGGFFSKLYEISYGALFRNLEGVTHEDSLIEPRPAGNSLNWVLGHIVATRNRLLPMLGAPPVWPPEQAFFYSGRVEAQWTTSNAFHLDAIKTDLARSQQQLMAVLDALPDPALSAPTDTGQPLVEVVGFFYFHESYHGGQIALLRRIVGRPGVIKAPTQRRLSGAQRSL
jgi:uncharacterized damage-inducible protein DinB